MELSAFLKDRWHGDSRLGELEELEVLIGKRGTRHDFEKEAAVTLTKSGVWLCAWCAWPMWNQKKKKDHWKIKKTNGQKKSKWMLLPSRMTYKRGSKSRSCRTWLPESLRFAKEGWKMLWKWQCGTKRNLTYLYVLGYLV